MRLAVGVISNRDWEPVFGVSLVNLYGYLVRKGVAGAKLDGLGFFPYLNCSNICQARSVVLKHAKTVEGGFTHLAFFDDDMAFPPDVLDQLGRHNVPVIGCNYQNKTNGKPTAVGLDGDYYYSKDKTGIEEVSTLGFGCILIDLSILDKMAEPWFAHAWIEEQKNTTTDDVYFCLMARKAGAKVYVENDASQKVRHLGKRELLTL